VGNQGYRLRDLRKGRQKRRLCLDDHKFIGAEKILLEAERRIKARADTASDGETEVTNDA